MELAERHRDDDRFATSAARVRRLYALERNPRAISRPVRDDQLARAAAIAADCELAPAVVKDALARLPRLRAFVLFGFEGVVHA